MHPRALPPLEGRALHSQECFLPPRGGFNLRCTQFTTSTQLRSRSSSSKKQARTKLLDEPQGCFLVLAGICDCGCQDAERSRRQVSPSRCPRHNLRRFQAMS
jgi:hypothetical protein